MTQASSFNNNNNNNNNNNILFALQDGLQWSYVTENNQSIL